MQYENIGTMDLVVGSRLEHQKWENGSTTF